jgi:hypothetical protein
LKEKNISMNSDLELKKFMIKQTEASINLEKETKEELKS